MIDLAGLPLILKTGGQASDQSVPPIGSLQQNGSAVGTALPLVKPNNDGLGKNLGEQQTLSRAIVDHAEASFVTPNTVLMFVTQEASRAFNSRLMRAMD